MCRSMESDIGTVSVRGLLLMQTSKYSVVLRKAMSRS